MCFSANLVRVKYTICRMPLCFYDEILLRAKITTKTEYSDVTSKNVTNIDEKMSIPLNQVLLDFQLGKYSDLKKKITQKCTQPPIPSGSCPCSK